MFDMPGAWDKHKAPINEKTGKPYRSLKESDWLVMDKKTKEKHLIEKVLVIEDTFEVMSTNEMKLNKCYKRIYNKITNTKTKRKLSEGCKTAMKEKRLVVLKINLYDTIIGYVNE